MTCGKSFELCEGAIAGEKKKKTTEAHLTANPPTMACRSCRSTVDLLAGCPVSLSRTNRAIGARLRPHPSIAALQDSRAQGQTRRLHSSPRVQESDERSMSLGRRLFRPLANKMQQIIPSVTEPYRVYGVTGEIYNACASQADYAISEKARKEGTLKTLEDGEEVGAGDTMWHNGELYHTLLLHSSIASVV